MIKISLMVIAFICLAIYLLLSLINAPEYNDEDMQL